MQLEEEQNCYYLTEKDAISGGKALYTLKKQLESDEEAYQFDDGEHILYVNGSYDKTDTPLGQLIHDFNCADPRKMISKLLRDKALYLKEGKEGVASMCRLWEEAKAEGKAEGKNEDILGLLENGLEVEFIAKALKVDIERVRKLKERLDNQVIDNANQQANFKGSRHGRYGYRPLCLYNQ